MYSGFKATLVGAIPFTSNTEITTFIIGIPVIIGIWLQLHGGSDSNDLANIKFQRSMFVVPLGVLGNMGLVLWWKVKMFYFNQLVYSKEFASEGSKHSS
jgi:hypothetical protein